MPYQPDRPILTDDERTLNSPLWKQLKIDADFDGWTYNPDLDQKRLTSQLKRVKAVMEDGHWRTLEELATIAGGSEASISARLRDLRKERHGSMTVERRRRGEETRGLFEYRLVK